MNVSKPDTTPCQRINIGSYDSRSPIARKVAIAKVVGKEHDDVGHRRRCLLSRGSHCRQGQGCTKEISMSHLLSRLF